MKLMKNKLYRIVRLLGVPIFKLLYRPTIIGQNNIPKKGSIVLCGNHTNNLDCALLISTTKRTIHFLAKDELHKGRLGWFFKSMATIPVDRKNKDKNAMDESLKVLNNNECIGIFPEGTINKTSSLLLPFKYGAVSMASKTNAYIVPFSITGKYKLFKKSITICFEKPYKVEKELVLENDRLMKKVGNLIIKNQKKC